MPFPRYSTEKHELSTEKRELLSYTETFPWSQVTQQDHQALMDTTLKNRRSRSEDISGFGRPDTTFAASRHVFNDAFIDDSSKRIAASLNSRCFRVKSEDRWGGPGVQKGTQFNELDGLPKWAQDMVDTEKGMFTQKNTGRVGGELNLVIGADYMILKTPGESQGNLGYVGPETKGKLHTKKQDLTFQCKAVQNQYFSR